MLYEQGIIPAAQFVVGARRHLRLGWGLLIAFVLAVTCGATVAQDTGADDPAAAPPAGEAVPAPDPYELVRNGNALFVEEEYAAALAEYDKARTVVPDAPEIAFNRGLTQLRLEEFGAATGTLDQAVLIPERPLEARAKFMLGNAYHGQAIAAQQQDPQAAIGNLELATQYYADALELRPDNDDARANIELAQRLIQMIKEQQQEEQQQQQQQCDEQQQEQQDEEEQQQQQQSDEQQQEQQDEEEQQQQQPGDEEEQQEQQEQQQQAEQQQGDEQQEQQALQPSEDEPQEQQEQDRRLSREQAERLLQQIRDKERQRRMEKAKQARRRAGKVKKDW